MPNSALDNDGVDDQVIGIVRAVGAIVADDIIHDGGVICELGAPVTRFVGMVGAI